MALNLLDLSQLGAIETNGTVTFGLWLPWVSDADGNAVTVKIIHESDKFLQHVPPREFPLTHSQRAPYGDFWSATVPIAATAPVFDFARGGADSRSDGVLVVGLLIESLPQRLRRATPNRRPSRRAGA